MRVGGAAVLLLAPALAAPGCSRRESTRQGDTAAQAPASGGGPASRVVITGSVNKTYTPSEVSAVKIADAVGISLYEEFPCGVSVTFPLALQPGTCPIEDILNLAGTVKVFARYGEVCAEDERHYASTSGKLVLTASGKSFSGSFEFAAGHVRDKSKTIHVSGSFRNASRP